MSYKTAFRKEWQTLKQIHEEDLYQSDKSRRGVHRL